MVQEHVDRLFTLVFAGGGMLLIGLVNLLVTTRSAWVRAAITIPIVTATVGGIALWTEDTVTTGRVAGLIGLGLLPSLLSGPGIRRAAQSLGFSFGSPAVRWGAMTAGGIILIAGSIGLYEREDAQWAMKETEEVMSVSTHAPHNLVPGVRASTDRGTDIRITACSDPRDDAFVDSLARKTLSNSGQGDNVIQRKSASELCNCHGWVFAGGQYALGGDEVEKIIAENGYLAVSIPKPGDIVIYRHENGRPSHTALVRYVTEGLPVLVEGKWGWMGVYLHDVDQSIYGKTYSYYRSPRAGHLLRLSSTNLVGSARP